MSFNTQQNNPLIQREQTYFLDKKHITIHSEDRDICKWPNSNHFEVTLPRNLKNVISMRLSDITIPSKIYNFSNEKQNTKFRLKVIPKINGSSLQLDAEYNALLNYVPNSPNYFEITIDDGYYTPNTLVNEMTNKINQTIQNELINIYATLNSNFDYSHFYVLYNETTNKIEIVNDRDGFALLFNREIKYETNCKTKNVWCNTTKWGFPYYIGYERKFYLSEINEGTYYNNSMNAEITPHYEKGEDIVYFATSNYGVNVFSDDVIYMEVEKYNNIDEIEPYSISTNDTFFNDYGGKTNSAFAKIPIGNNACKTILFKTEQLHDITPFKIPLKDVRKLKFRFRYHDGRLVDFRHKNLNFTIEACELIDEQPRFKLVNSVYSL